MIKETKMTNETDSGENRSLSICVSSKEGN